MTTIESFRGQYRFLSNFYPAPTPFRNKVFPSSEHAFMSAKTDDPKVIDAIAAADSPGEAKRLGRKVVLVPGWDDIRLDVMREVVKSKFTHNPKLIDQLVATKDADLIEGNTWHDQFWGDCVCPEHWEVPGSNHLGLILMELREALTRPEAM